MITVIGSIALGIVCLAVAAWLSSKIIERRNGNDAGWGEIQQSRPIEEPVDFDSLLNLEWNWGPSRPIDHERVGI